MKLTRSAASTKDMRNAYIISVGKPEGKTLLGRPGCRWEDIIRMNFRKIVWECVDGI
jgi:hypothetical protein